jgi:hypothetical protein
LKALKKLFKTLVILLVSKLQDGRDVNAQELLKLKKKEFQTLVILLVLKLQAGNDVNAQELLKERKKLSQGLLALSPNQSSKLGIYSTHTLSPVNQDEGTNPYDAVVKVHLLQGLARVI